MQPEMDRDAAAREHARRRQARAEKVQRRRMALGIISLGLIVLVIALVIGLSGGGKSTSSSTTSSTAPLENGNYSAHLTGALSVPKVNTQATADFILTYDSTKKELSYVLDITHDLSKPSTAAIYEGKAGSSGAVVYTLPITAPNANSGVFLGKLCEGIVNESNLTGSLAGKTIADLIKLIKDGTAYVSVGTPSHPVDAIRAPIQG